MRLFRDPTVRFLAAATVLTGLTTGGALLAGAADSDDPLSAPSPSTSVPEVDAEPVIPPETTCPEAASDVGRLRECLRPSLVFIDTPASVGTGVLLDNGLVVTNAHVVDPYSRVGVTFVDGDRMSDVEVIGIDMASDIALLDLVDVEGLDGGMTLAPIPAVDGLERSDLFLVGFPAGLERNGPEIAITRGVLSRLRESAAFEQVWLQTDAAIVGGQSGGALVDGSGRLLGISGYSYAGVLSFALSADDVLEAIDRINTGQGPEWTSIAMPGVTLDEPTTVEFPAAFVGRRIVLPPADDDRTVHLTVDSGQFEVDIYTASGLQIGYFEQQRAGAEDDFGGFDDEEFGSDWYERDLEPFGFGGALDVDDDGVISFLLPADEAGVIDMYRDVRGTLDVTLDVPYQVVGGSREAGAVGNGETVSGHTGSIGGAAVHEVALKSGDRLVVDVIGSPTNPTVQLLPPTDDPLEAGQRSGFEVPTIGFLDELIPMEFEITRPGTFQLVVSSPTPAEYQLSVLIE